MATNSGRERGTIATSAGDSDSGDFGYKQELRRSLGFWDLLIYGMVFMVPIAPMGIYGFVVGESHGLVPLVYGIGIVAMVFTALSYRAMSREFAISGSVYSYVQRGINPHVGFIPGWMILIDYILVPALLYKFSATWFHAVLPAVPLYAYVIAFIVAITAVNVVGINVAARVNFALLAVELLILLVFIGYAIDYVFVRGGGTGGFSIQPFYRPEFMNAGFFATATSLAVLSFLGFDAISTLAEETKNPRRNVGNATVASLVVLGFIFIVQTYLAGLVHPKFSTLNPALGFFQLGRDAGGAPLYYLLIGVNILAAGIANALVAQIAVARVIYSISRDGLLPGSRLLGRINDRFQTPANATLFVAAVSILVAAIVGLESISRFVNFGALTSFMFLHVAVFWYFVIKRGRRDLRGILQYAVMPAIGLAIIAYVWSGFDRLTFEFGLSWLGLGILIGAWRSHGYRTVPPALRSLEAD